MKTLNLTFTVEISDEEATYLKSALDCPSAEIPDLQAELSRYGPAAMREYIDMFTGAHGITTATDVRERRLLGLMLDRFKSASPAPDTVARLFNLTPSAARALLRAVAGKYRLKLAQQLEAAISTVLSSAKKQDDGSYTVLIINGLVLELLTTELKAAKESKTGIRPNKDSINNFTIDKGSYDYLRARHP